MLTITPLSNQGSARNGAAVLDYLRATEYYRSVDGASESASRWIGRGAASLGLSGYVDDADMVALSKGFSPRDGKALCQNAGAPGTWTATLDANGQPELHKNGTPKGRLVGGHRVGYDLTFSCPKSVSVVFAAAEPQERERLLSAHRSAVDAALRFVELDVETRRGKAGRDSLAVSGLVVSGHTHFGSRDLDPQLHEHSLVYAVAQGADGQWGTFEPKRMFEAVKAAGALYRCALADGLQKLGYGIEQDRERDADGRENGNVFFKIAGVSDELCEHFSKRRHDILAHMQAKGGTAQQACLATRKRKDEPTFDELSDYWQAALDVQRQLDPTMFRSVDELKGRAHVLEQADDAASLRRLHANDALWTRQALVERLAQDRVGSISPDELLGTELDAFVKRAGVMALRPEAPATDRPLGLLSRSHTEPRFAAQWMLDLENEFTRAALARKDDTSVRLDPQTVAGAVARFQLDKGLTLTHEQQAAVKWITQDSGGTCCISGLAGTGKTATAGAWIAAFQHAGHEVLGVSTGWNAAKKLETETGVPSVSAAALLSKLDKGRQVLTNRSVVLFDEAGMAGTPTLRKLQEHCDRAGAKLVLQGDGWQLQPVEAGSPFRLAIAAVGDARLTEIRRQRSAEDRTTAAMFYGKETTQRGSVPRSESVRHGAAILKRLEKRGQMQVCDDAQEATSVLVADYLASPTPAREKLVLGGTLAEVRALNAAVRTGLQAQGNIGPNVATFSAKSSGRWCDLQLAVGDRVRFAERSTTLGVVNGMVGVVEAAGAGATGGLDLRVRVESDSGKPGGVVAFNTNDFASLTHAYAMTVHKAQGQGMAEVFQLANPQMTDTHLALVGFTRAKQSFRLYAAADDLAQLTTRLGTERLKANASEERVPTAKKRMEAPVVPAGLLDKAAARFRQIKQTATERWKTLTAPMVPKKRRDLGPSR